MNHNLNHTVERTPYFGRQYIQPYPGEKLDKAMKKIGYEQVCKETKDALVRATELALHEMLDVVASEDWVDTGEIKPAGETNPQP